MQDVRGIASEKRHDIAGGNPRGRIVLSHGALGSDRFVVEDNRRKLTAAFAIVCSRKCPRTQHGAQRTVRAEPTFVVHCHRVDARLRVRLTRRAHPRRAERNQYRRLLIEASTKLSQLCGPVRSTDPFLPRFVCDFDREDLVLAPSRHCCKSIAGRLARPPAWRKGAPPNSV